MDDNENVELEDGPTEVPDVNDEDELVNMEEPTSAEAAGAESKENYGSTL